MDRPFSDKRPIGPFVGSSGDRFEEEERSLGPVAFVRKFQERAVANPDGGRVSEMGLGTISWENFGAGMKVEYGFNESSVENTFSFQPIGAREGGGERPQGTTASELGGQVGKVASIIDSAFLDDQFEFAELDAASVGFGYLTSYEFGYEGTTSLNRLENEQIDDHVN